MNIFETYSQGMAVCLLGSGGGEHEVEVAGEVGAFSAFFFLQIDDEGGFAGPWVSGDVWVALEVALGDEAGVTSGLGHVVDVRGAGGVAHAVGGGLDGFVFVAAGFVGEEADAVFEIGGRGLGAAAEAAGLGEHGPAGGAFFVLEIINALVVGLPNIEDCVGEGLFGFVAPEVAGDDEQLAGGGGRGDLAAEGGAAGPEGAEDVRVGGLKFSLGEDVFAGAGEVVDVAVDVLGGRGGQGVGAEGEGATGGGEAAQRAEGEKVAAVGL